ncbi:hypothetical protein Y1Q_0019639 [Alligator mississippiensis]|uniref:Uncharacterized protein n=1 Tax=Alligator mississippiensis TaxID=8496 RepID=A0A151PEK8_ALLMI|nr:hypothetical protein Y1Q_0019639 [Alligator mississippiensis]
MRKPPKLTIPAHGGNPRCPPLPHTTWEALHQPLKVPRPLQERNIHKHMANLKYMNRPSGFTRTTHGLKFRN